MTRYVARRLLWALALLVGVSLLTFVIFYLLPSADPAALRAGKAPTPALIAEIRHSLGLDRPWYEQYLHYMERLLFHFDLGYSYQSDVPVRTALAERLPATLSLALGAAVVWLVLGVAAGTISAVRRGTAVDRAAMGAALVGISAPVYWLALLSLFLFAQDVGKVHLLPGAGSYVPLTEDPGGWLGSLVLPWLVLGFSFAAVYARLLRATLSSALAEDYIRTARATGLSERRVVLRHGMRSAITPVMSAAGVDLGMLLGGAILTETAFNIPGIGRLAYEAVLNGDLPMIQGTVLLGALFIVLANLLVDILYAYLDPRVRYA
jgi:peptide/nickel transport system permease protein